MLGITWRKPVKKLSPLKKELKDLITKYNKIDRLMCKLSDDFWRNGGSCCPSCGVPGYSKLSMQQENRERRLYELKDKIFLDSQSTVDPLKWAYINHLRKKRRIKKIHDIHTKAPRYGRLWSPLL